MARHPFGCVVRSLKDCCKTNWFPVFRLSLTQSKQGGDSTAHSRQALEQSLPDLQAETPPCLECGLFAQGERMTVVDPAERTVSGLEMPFKGFRFMDFITGKAESE